jgi:hypothetical protein
VDDKQQDVEQFEDVERFESIPWSSLLPEQNTRRARLVGISIAVALTVVAGLIAFRAFGSTTPGTVVALDAPPSADSAVAPTEPTVVISQTPDTTVVENVSVAADPAPSTPPVAFSEADLMAGVPDTSMRAAIMRAEWFVTDYFTVDSDATSDAVTAALGPLDGLVLPHQDPVGVSYVEWARAYAAQPLPTSGYRVAVAFRTLSAPDGEDVVRRPVRAVEVDVAVEPGGATIVLDLPRPVLLPQLTQVTSAESALVRGLGSSARAPADVEAAAIAAAGVAGSSVSVLGAEPRDGGWRFVIAVTDDSGMAFPVAIWLPAS